MMPPASSIPAQSPAPEPRNQGWPYVARERSQARRDSANLKAGLPPGRPGAPRDTWEAPAVSDKVVRALLGMVLGERLAGTALTMGRWIAAPLGMGSMSAVALGVAVLGAPLAAPFLAMSAMMPSAVAGVLAPLATHGSSAAAVCSLYMTSVTGWSVGLPIVRAIANQSGLTAMLKRINSPVTIDHLLQVAKNGVLLSGGAVYGMSLAPLVAAAAMPGAAVVACAAVPMALAGMLLLGAAVGQSLSGVPDFTAAASLGCGLGVATMTWSFLAGALAPMAVLAGAGACALGAIAGAMGAAGAAKGRARVPTTVADSHVTATQSSNTSRLHTDASGEQTVFGTPPSFLTRLEELQRKARTDDQGRTFWPGQPVVNWMTQEGVGQTVHAHALARELGGDCIRLTGAQLRCMESPGFNDLGVIYLLTVWLQAEERALRVGRPQVVVVENLQQLMPRPKDVAPDQTFLGFQKLFNVVINLAVSNGYQHRTVLVFTGSDDGGSNTVRKAMSPRAPVQFVPLTTASRRHIIDGAVARLQGDLKAAGHSVSYAFWDHAPWQNALRLLSEQDVGGRLLQDIVADLQAAAVDAQGGAPLEAGLQATLKAATKRVAALVASRQPSPVLLPDSEREPEPEDNFGNFLNQMLSDPAHMMALVKGSAKRALKQSLSVRDAARSRYLNRLLERTSENFMGRATAGISGDQNMDYTDAWMLAALESWQDHTDVERQAFEKEYVYDVNYPPLTHQPAMHLYMARMRAHYPADPAIFQKRVNASFAGTEVYPPMFQTMLPHERAAISNQQSKRSRRL